MPHTIHYHYPAKIWKHNAPNSWYFVSLPKAISKEIRANLQWQEEGWGRMKITASIKNVQWQTAIWFDTKLDTYLLPLKAEIRKKLRLKLEQEIEVDLYV